MRKNILAELRRFEWLRINRPETIIYATLISNTKNREWCKFPLKRVINPAVFIENSIWNNTYFYTEKRPHRAISKKVF